MQTLRFKSLEVRLAETEADADAAQALRYRIFYDEIGAKPTPSRKKLKRDVDPYDDICDHLLVIDLERGSAARPEVVGTYRLLRGAVAEASAGFYSEGEFDLAGLLRHSGEIMELGRSCISADYRRRGAMQLLWRGIADYIFEHKVEVMFGCGSIHGTDVNEAKRALAYGLALARGRLHERADVSVVAARAVHVLADGDEPWQVDGDAAGALPLVATLDDRTVRLVAGPGAFGDDPSNFDQSA